MNTPQIFIGRPEEPDISKLVSEKLAVEQEVIDIESQLHQARVQARTTGVYADAGWFTRTTHKLNQLKLKLKKINITLSAMQKEDRATSGLPYKRIAELEQEITQYQAMETYLYARIKHLEEQLCDKRLKTRSYANPLNGSASARKRS